MKLLYIAPRDFPRRVANRVQTMKMAEAFSRQCDFLLCVSKLYIKPPELWDYYGVTHPFPIHELGVAPFGPQSVYAILPSLLQIRKHKPDVVFFREERIGWFLSFFVKRFVYEMHAYNDAFARIYPRLVGRSALTIVVSDGLKRAAEQAGLPGDKLEVHPAGVDVQEIDVDLDPSSARQQARLPTDRRLVVYTGRLSTWKGVDVLLESTRHMPDDVLTVFVGGFEGEPEVLQAKAKELDVERRVLIVGHKPHSEIPVYLRAADVLVLPNSPVSVESTDFTSPLKLVEYAAARRPIVASDFPAIREIVDDGSAIMVAGGDPKALADGISRALKGGPQIEAKVAHAYQRAEMSSWDHRAERILASLGKS